MGGHIESQSQLSQWELQLEVYLVQKVLVPCNFEAEITQKFIMFLNATAKNPAKYESRKLL